MQDFVVPLVQVFPEQEQLVQDFLDAEPQQCLIELLFHIHHYLSRPHLLRMGLHQVCRCHHLVGILLSYISPSFYDAILLTMVFVGLIL